MKNNNIAPSSNLRISIILIVIAVILSIPLIAMQFTKEVNWNLTDFIAAGILLFSAGLAIELVMRFAKSITLRNILFFAILLLLFLIWAELAVGVFGTPLAGS